MCSPDMPEVPDPPSAVRTPTINASELFGARRTRSDPRFRTGYASTVSSSIGVLTSNAANQKRLLGG